MKRAIRVLICAVAVLMLASSSSVAQTAEELFQKGVRLEEVRGELEQAIEAYKSVVKKYPKSTQLAVQSLLRMGKCYEKLGNVEARKAYEKIVNDYGSQREAVAEAQARLAALAAGLKVQGAPLAQKLLDDNVEPTIENPAILMPSPDGRWVAYTQGDVFIRNLESGEVKHIASGKPAVNNWTVVWSPDGKQLAYWQQDLKTKQGAIKILDLGLGTTVTAFHSGESELSLRDWSRDGRFLLCIHAPNTLVLVSIKDSTITTLADSVWKGQRAAFSPDGRFVAYASGPHAQEKVYTQPIAGGPRHLIASAQKEQNNVYLHPLWSPDGKAIAYQQPDGIWVVPVTNGEASGPARLAYKTDLPRWIVAWTQSGGFYLTNNGTEFQPYAIAVDPKTGILARSEPQKILDVPDDFSDFAWAPDARHIVYTGWGDKLRIYATDTKTMTTYDVGGRMAYRPARSSNANEILFEVGDPATQSAFVRALNVTTGKTRDLFPPMQKFAYSFSSDGQTMASVRRSPRGAEVAVGPTGQPEGRIVAAGMMAIPELSPKGNQLFIIRKGEAAPECGGANGSSLWLMASDSSSTRRIASAWGITSGVWDPSGRFIAYLARPDSGAEARDLRIIDVASGNQAGQVMLTDPRWGKIQLSDWSGDGASIGFYTMNAWWDYWVIQGLQDGGKQP